jgi:hypothetical protein
MAQPTELNYRPAVRRLSSLDRLELMNNVLPERHTRESMVSQHAQELNPSPKQETYVLPQLIPSVIFNTSFTGFLSSHHAATLSRGSFVVVEVPTPLQSKAHSYNAVEMLAVINNMLQFSQKQLCGNLSS